ncbi:hypothetical protein ACWCPT_29565 [Streptomyces sp. NPDC002308]
MTTADIATVSLSREQAQELTTRIQAAIEDAWALICEAYTTRAWCALGYESWDAYVEAEFGRARLSLPKEDRSSTLAELRSAGMSIPAIATATGLGVGTVHRTLSVATFPPGKVATAKTITGVNGKTYRPVPRTATAPPQEQIHPPDEDDNAIPRAGDELSGMANGLRHPGLLDALDVHQLRMLIREGRAIVRLSLEELARRNTT